MTSLVPTLPMLLSILMLIIDTPVPTDQLVGGRLVAKDANFSIETPSGEVRWSRTVTSSGGVSYAARVSEGVIFRIIVTGSGSAFRNDSSSMGEFRDGLTSSMLKGGMAVEDFSFHAVSQPLDPSHTYTCRLRRADGTMLDMDGYLAAAGRIYNLQYISVGRDRLAQFRRFVSSLRLLSVAEHH
jgi:hypothetical protein